MAHNSSSPLNSSDSFDPFDPFDLSTLDFAKAGGLLPAIVQDAQSARVLMLGYMNAAALEQTLSTGKVTFFSRSKQRLWMKGETSGNVLKLVEIRRDCDGDTLLVKALPTGAVCHTGAATCFVEESESVRANANADAAQFLSELERIVLDRKAHPVEGSYTNKLLARGINKVAQKVGEEAVELVIEAKDNNDELFVGEAADLLFHTLVLFAAKDIPLKRVVAELERRHAGKQ
jgi:phosphoribosyl-AMP cyclohydrolase / phosphoribosyl-ATP pyrophosphohydrolase